MGKKEPEKRVDKENGADIMDPVESNKVEDLRVLEAVLFASDALMTTARLKAILPGQPDVRKIRSMVEKINVQLQKERHPFEIVEIGGGFQFRTIAFYHPWVRQLFKEKAVKKLSIQALECLAIIAYKQPISKAEIEAIRGVVSDGAMKTLLEKHLATIAGRSDKPGRPLLYGTTHSFLTYFGLNKIDDLPRIEEFEALAREKMDELTFDELEGAELSEEEAAVQEQAAESEKGVRSEESSVFEVTVENDEEGAASADESGSDAGQAHEVTTSGSSAETHGMYTDATVKDMSLPAVEHDDEFEVNVEDVSKGRASEQGGIESSADAQVHVSTDTTAVIGADEIPDMSVEETIADADLNGKNKIGPATPEATVSLEMMSDDEDNGAADGPVSSTVVLGTEVLKSEPHRSAMADEATVFDMSSTPEETSVDAVFEVTDNNEKIERFSEDDIEKLGGALTETKAIRPEELKRTKNLKRGRQAKKDSQKNSGGKNKD